MPKQNFYDLAKEKAKKKVAEKVRAKKQVPEPYDAGEPDVYVVNGVRVFRPRGMCPPGCRKASGGTLISRTRSGTTYIT